jgi:hypothetical protein
MKRIGLITLGVFVLILFASCSANDPSYRAFVWEDSNGDGRQAEDEEPISGVVIQIINQSNGLLWMRSITDADGFTFPFKAGTTCGEYTLQINVPDEYWPTTPVIQIPQNCETVNFGLKEFP